MNADEFVEFVTQKAEELADMSTGWLVWDKNAPLNEWIEQFIFMLEEFGE